MQTWQWEKRGRFPRESSTLPNSCKPEATQEGTQWTKWSLKSSFFWGAGQL